jgi:hypothetical protein
MLAALEDGCATRQEIHAHAGVFFLTNNAASDLRRAGVDVVWVRETDTYHLDAGLTGGTSAAVADTALTADETVRTHGSGTAVTSETVGERQGWHLPSAEQDGQLIFEVAA